MAFTPITWGLDWSAVSFINELRGAQFERATVAGLSGALSDIAVGADLQDKSGWLAIQNWLESNCVNFVNHTLPIAGETSIVLFTVPTWRSVAGLHASGFRRAREWNPAVDDWTNINDPMYSYGVMQAGDIIGPWIFDDLQKGLDALRWTKKTANSENTWLHSGTAYHGDCDQARLDFLTDWTNNDWFETGVHPYYFAYGQAHDTYVFVAYRGKAKYNASLISEYRPHSASIYLLPCVWNEWPFDSEFLDIDGLGMTENKFFLYETLGEATTSSRTTTMLSPSEMSPIEKIPIVCPITDVVVYGIAAPAWDARWILDWNFVWKLP